jgi:hypothetical protein
MKLRDMETKTITKAIRSVFFTSSTDGSLFLNFIRHVYQLHNQIYKNEIGNSNTFISTSNSEVDKTALL